MATKTAEAVPLTKREEERLKRQCLKYISIVSHPFYAMSATRSGIHRKIAKILNRDPSSFDDELYKVLSNLDKEVGLPVGHMSTKERGFELVPKTEKGADHTVRKYEEFARLLFEKVKCLKVADERISPEGEPLYEPRSIRECPSAEKGSWNHKDWEWNKDEGAFQCKACGCFDDDESQKAAAPSSCVIHNSRFRRTCPVCRDLVERKGYAFVDDETERAEGGQEKMRDKKPVQQKRIEGE